MAATEFALRGFDGASTRSIAKLADVPHTLVLYYFESKEKLWFDAARNLFEPFFEREKQLASTLENKDATEKLKLIYADFIRFSAAEPRFHRLMANEGRSRSERLAFLLKAVNLRSTRILADLIKQSQKDGKFVEGDPYQLVYVMVGAATNTFALAAEFEIVSGKSPFEPKAVERHVQTCIRVFFRD